MNMHAAIGMSTADVQFWASRPARETAGSGNALTVDVEDYFQVEAFSGRIDRAQWDSRECRIERNVDHILEMFAAAGAKGTFFTLGWIAQRYPALIRAIAEQGHEVASHGFHHQRADRVSRT